MSSRSFSKVLRSPLARQLTSQTVQRRTFIALTRATALGRASAVPGPVHQQVRGVKTIDFAGSKEQVWGESGVNLGASGHLILAGYVLTYQFRA
jgi:ketol-acid reductoisomerase